MQLFIGVRVPNRAYECIPITIDEITTSKLKSEISKKINFPENEIELLYAGNVLEDSDKIDIAPKSIIQVLKKTPKHTDYVSSKTYTKEDCKKISELFGTVTGTQISVGIRINILSKILLEYPEFRRNLGAQALIRDSVLFHSLDKPEVIEKVAENYSIICDAAEFIVKTTKKELAKNVNVSYSEESFSDLTSSSEEENSNAANQNDQQRMIRRITHDQLQAALSTIGSASRNSLSNIAQRNANLLEEEQGNQPNQDGPSNSSPNMISSSVLHSALRQALVHRFNRTRETSSSQNADDSMDTTETQDTPSIVVNDVSNSDTLTDEYRNHQYRNQLRIMREMGLTNDENNANILTITAGDVENAINLALNLNYGSDLGNQSTTNEDASL